MHLIQCIIVCMYNTYTCIFTSHLHILHTCLPITYWFLYKLHKIWIYMCIYYMNIYMCKCSFCDHTLLRNYFLPSFLHSSHCPLCLVTMGCWKLTSQTQSKCLACWAIFIPTYYFWSIYFMLFGYIYKVGFWIKSYLLYYCF